MPRFGVVVLVLFSLAMGYLLNEVTNLFFTELNQDTSSLVIQNPFTENDSRISFGTLGFDRVTIIKNDLPQAIYIMKNSGNTFFSDASFVPPSSKVIMQPGSHKEPDMDLNYPQDYERNLRGRNVDLY